MGTASLNLAHLGPNMPLAPERDPVKLFNTLFGMGTPMGLPIEISNQLRRSVLDAVLADAKRLQSSLGSADSKRIDAHMDSVRSLEMRIPMGGVVPPPMPTCQAPTTPTEKAANLDLAKVTATSKVMNKLIAVALSCNMTRVYSHLWSGARDDNHYPIVQLDTEHHALTHSAVQSEYDKAANIEKYIMSQYADLAQTLKDTPMGAGNLLDNTIIYGISDVAEPRGHVMKNYHIVLMGKAGGKIKGNRHYRKTGRKVTELMLTLQKVMGMNVSSFGSWDKTSTTMQEILA